MSQLLKYFFIIELISVFLKVKIEKRRKKKAKPEEEKEGLAVIPSKNTQKAKPDQKQNLKKDKIDPLDPRSENEKVIPNLLSL